jgi:protein-arginine kinase activator protein McsA
MDDMSNKVPTKDEMKDELYFLALKATAKAIERDDPKMAAALRDEARVLREKHGTGK